MFNQASAVERAHPPPAALLFRGLCSSWLDKTPAGVLSVTRCHVIIFHSSFS